MVSAAIYCRVSTADQVKGASIGSQVRELTDLAGSFGLEIVREYIDAGRTGSDMDRADLQQMLTDGAAGLFRVLLVYHNDRLSRNVEDVRRIIRELGAVGVMIRFKNISQDLTTPEGKFTLNVMAAASEFYIDDLKRKTRDGMAERKRSGTWTGRINSSFELIDKGRGQTWDNIQMVESTRADTLEMFQLRESGKSWRFIGSAFGLDHKKVKRIVNLYSWLKGQYLTRGRDL